MDKFLNYALAGMIIIASISALGMVVFGGRGASTTEYACTMDARICPDGTAVGRVGPSCEFAPCPNEGSGLQVNPETPDPSGERTDDLIVLTSPQPSTRITSPVTLTGKARGYWYFEGSFPVSIVN